MSAGFCGNRRQEGRVRPLVLGLVAVVALGTWNYQRNAEADRDDPRAAPFARYGTQDLYALRDAYRGEVEAGRRVRDERRAELGGASAAVRRPSSLAPGIENFEASQARAGALRGATADLAQNEARLAEVEAELAHRQDGVWKLRLHLERLVHWR